MVFRAAILLVALATNDVNGQGTLEYDLKNCSIHRVANQTHHADDPNNCRVFYNCDNANGGKLTSCPEGTVYDAERGICDSGGDCQTWNRLADCARFPTGVRNFSAQCCHTYFQYDCSSHTFQFRYCEPGLWFNGGSCNPLRPVAGCVFCNTSVFGDRCEYTNLEYRGPCTFRHRASLVDMRCADGTAMDPVQCTCVLDEASVCTRSMGCQTKHSLIVNPPRAPGQSSVSDSVALYYLRGQDFGYQSFSVLLRFTLYQDHIISEIPILTADPDDSGFKVEVRVLGLNTVKVTVASRGESMTLQSNDVVPDRGEYSVRAAFDLNGGLFLARVNGVDLNPDIGDYNHYQTLDRWADKGIVGVGLLRLRTYYANILEMSFWRQCTDFEQMN